MIKKLLVKFYWNYGSMGDLEGLFIATEDKLKSWYGREAYFVRLFQLSILRKVINSSMMKDMKKVMMMLFDINYALGSERDE